MQTVLLDVKALKTIIKNNNDCSPTPGSFFIGNKSEDLQHRTEKLNSSFLFRHQPKDKYHISELDTTYNTLRAHMGAVAQVSGIQIYRAKQHAYINRQ